VEKEEIKAAKTQETDRAAAPSEQSESRPADQRWILALQHSAGNRAVADLLARAPRAPDAIQGAPSELSVQRAPDGPEEEPVPKEERVWPVAWPEEAEGERNEPCFDPDSQSMIKAGSAWADGAAGELSKMPPDLQTAAGAIKAAAESWESASGSDPGQAQLNEAKATLNRAWVTVSTRVEPVGAMLEQLRAAAMAAFSTAADAATTRDGPLPREEVKEGEPDTFPCFEEGQRATITKACLLAHEAAAELGKRPPDYVKALATLRSAHGALTGVGGLEPGQKMLDGAMATLGTVLDGVDAYLTPVATVVANAAEDLRSASAQANATLDMAKRGEYYREPSPG
jgi:hypothetical protein